MGIDAVLDRQIWNMLNGELRSLAQGNSLAMRIDPVFGPFAVARDGEGDAQAALSGLMRSSNDELWLVETDEWPAPPSLKIRSSAPLAQMVADPASAASSPSVNDTEIVALTDADGPEMMQLALATEPGPWGHSTHRYGQYYGLRVDGRIVAMAGERMRPSPEIRELSGVCTLPEYRGRGFARRLIGRVMARHKELGLRTYLHSYARNAGAIGLYESLGFRTRREMVVTILERA